MHLVVARLDVAAKTEWSVRSRSWTATISTQDANGEGGPLELRIGPMLGFKGFRTAATTIAGIRAGARLKCN